FQAEDGIRDRNVTGVQTCALPISGADDYLPKPFGMMELVSRIKAVLRRTEEPAQEEYRVGSLYVCPARHIVRAGDQEVHLALKEIGRASCRERAEVAQGRGT